MTRRIQSRVLCDRECENVIEPKYRVIGAKTSSIFLPLHRNLQARFVRRRGIDISGGFGLNVGSDLKRGAERMPGIFAAGGAIVDGWIPRRRWRRPRASDCNRRAGWGEGCSLRGAWHGRHKDFLPKIGVFYAQPLESLAPLGQSSFRMGEDLSLIQCPLNTLSRRGLPGVQLHFQ